jgi:hypothetical protein
MVFIFAALDANGGDGDGGLGGRRRSPRARRGSNERTTSKSPGEKNDEIH